MPVRDGFWPFYSYHFITAGHCIDDNDGMGQPDWSASLKIADSTDSRYVGDCDCAISTKTTSTTYSGAWRSSSTLLATYEESTSRPADGTFLTFSGLTSNLVNRIFYQPPERLYQVIYKSRKRRIHLVKKSIVRVKPQTMYKLGNFSSQNRVSVIQKRINYI